MKIAISGYFDPIHVGHINLIRDAAKFGDVWVIINNDKQAKKKKGYVFMPQDERLTVVGNIRGVKGFMIAIDKDATVCESIKHLNPDVFANGGDRLADNTPEMKVCKEQGIMTLFGVGGDKTQSSSELVKKAREYDRLSL